MYLIGEALVGEGDELAHIDLVIGDKSGPVGQAFANGLSQLSAGHTPVLAVIRPNLPSKPFTLVVPKVTVKDMEEANRIFGPAQAAVAKAVADSVEEGVFPKDSIEDLVVIASVFVSTKATDYRKIYHYNYSATKLALKRALTGYPGLDKIMYEKDRAKHPIMGFRVPRLWRPPYLQIALDIPDLQRTLKIIDAVPTSDRIILEAGTPLLKKYGTNVIKDLREVAKDIFIVADLKTLDVGKVEVDIAYDQTADAVVASGLAAAVTLDAFIYEAKRLGIYAMLDMMNVDDPIKKLSSLKELPDIVILHRSIDVERAGGEGAWNVKELKDAFKGKKMLVAVAGGITPDKVSMGLKQGADILIVGRYITQSKDVERAVREFIVKLPESEVDLLREHVE
ncbi:MAG: bifunctional 5,6,7,8-tetrahydromethanopterin hydro-lyase/3-hexulose-6-phosphate synthase [Promethearchaeati archaeon SRVP18_Atabeyarchaeia-1]